VTIPDDSVWCRMAACMRWSGFGSTQRCSEQLTGPWTLVPANLAPILVVLRLVQGSAQSTSRAQASSEQAAEAIRGLYERVTMALATGTRSFNSRSRRREHFAVPRFGALPAIAGRYACACSPDRYHVRSASPT
jgi:hypothetical protein